MSKNDDTRYGLIGYVRFNDFYCPKCHNYKEIFNAQEDKDFYICNWCNAKFKKQEPDFSNYPQVRIPMIFETYMCKSCWEESVKDNNSLCEKCKQSGLQHKNKRIKTLEKEIEKLKKEVD